MSKIAFTRRDFLKFAGISLAASTVICSGFGYAATLTPESENSVFCFGKENSVAKKILVTYATRAGSTVEVASAIGESLGNRGFEVDVKPVKVKPLISGYQAVVFGSAIRMGSWLPEMLDFIKANQPALKAMPVALFTVHMLNIGDDEPSRVARLAYLNAVRPMLNQIDEVYFAGKMDFSRLSLIDRFIANMVKSVEADNRDWDKIRNWSPTLFA